MSQNDSKRERRFIGVVGLLQVVALCIALGGTARAEERAPSNLDLMTILTEEVVNDLIAQMGSGIGPEGVLLQPHASTERYDFLTNVVTSVLTKRGVLVYPPSAAAPGGEVEGGEARPLLLKYRTIAYGVTYQQVYRSYLIAGRKVRRRADVNVQATLLRSGGGAVAWIGEASRSHEDQFGYGELGRIEEGDLQFTRPELPSGGWGKYAEPVLVSGIVVGLIYLFFSNQSDS